MTVRIALARMMMEDLKCMLMDVETAFLYGEIEKEIYMEIPVGIKEVFSSPDEADEEMLPITKRNIWSMSISKTILDKVCHQNVKN